MTPLFVAALVASLMGSLHCAGMCGGIVAMVASCHREKASGWPHVAYHGGRLLGYLGVGALAGAVGKATDHAGEGLGIGSLATTLFGVALVVTGVLALAKALGGNTLHPRVPRWIQAPALAINRRVHGLPPTGRGLALGLATPLLPCGWLYAFVLAAAATGSVVQGSLVLLAFWMGTVPVLALVSAVLESSLVRLRARLPIVTSILLVALGVLTLTSRVDILPVLPVVAEKQLTDTPDGAPAPLSIDLPTTAPCCDEGSQR